MFAKVRQVVHPLVRMSSSVATTAQQVVTAEASAGRSEVIAAVSGFPSEQKKRTVRITEPARKVTQSGSFGRGGGWTLTWDTQERWENVTMGWASTADPLSNLVVDFDSVESAKAFCEKNGWNYYVHQQPKKKMVRGEKLYGHNFSWDTRRRTNTK